MNRKISLDRNLILLVLINTMPLVGYLFFSWSVFGIIYFYWLETVVIAFWMIVKVLKTDLSNFETDQNSPPSTQRFGLALFLMIFFGVGLAMHRLFIAALFGESDVEKETQLLSLIALFIVHGITFYERFIHSGEYLKPTGKSDFHNVTKRIFILHLTIIIGGGIATIMSEPIGAIVAMVAFKIIVEARHLGSKSTEEINKKDSTIT